MALLERTSNDLHHRITVWITRWMSGRNLPPSDMAAEMDTGWRS